MADRLDDGPVWRIRICVTDKERDFLDALAALEEGLKAPGNGGAHADVRGLLRKLEDAALTLLPEADRELKHYLERKSHEKARLYLLGRDHENEKGPCHPR
jgi:hypothetical protein